MDWIVSEKSMASIELKFGKDLSERRRMRLKSPMIAQGLVIVEERLTSKSKKARFSDGSQGRPG